jgi:hypothetical protein
LYVTVEVETRENPVMVKVVAAVPALAKDGERLVMMGARLFTVKSTDPEAPPPGAGFVTTTG